VIPFSLSVLATLNSYLTAGAERGTATSTSTRPGTTSAWTVTTGLVRNRFVFPADEEVQNPTRPSSSGTIHVGVATAAPDLRNVATEANFSSAMLMQRV